MQTCSMMDFIQVLKPWLDRDYIRKGYLDSKGNFRLFFTDGNQSETARILGVSRVTIWKRIKKYGIDLEAELEA